MTNILQNIYDISPIFIQNLLVTASGFKKTVLDMENTTIIIAYFY